MHVCLMCTTLDFVNSNVCQGCACDLYYLVLLCRVKKDRMVATFPLFSLIAHDSETEPDKCLTATFSAFQTRFLGYFGEENLFILLILYVL